mmetsp:Transcript_101345/g.325687  ORF Transcript_101345/g.325687 Transcript_101345/m.325687 type:complete len:278 (-) Transcript_101345:3875-4708(-)
MACSSSFSKMFTTCCVATTIRCSRRLMRSGSESPPSKGFRAPHSAATLPGAASPLALLTAATAFVAASSSIVSPSSVVRKWSSAGKVKFRRRSATFARVSSSPPSQAELVGPARSTEPCGRVSAPTETERLKAHLCRARAPALSSFWATHDASKADSTSSTCSFSERLMLETTWSLGRSPSRNCCNLSLAWSANRAGLENSGNAFNLSHLVSTSTGGNGWPVDLYKSTSRCPCKPNAVAESNAPTQTNKNALDWTKALICRHTIGLSKPGVSMMEIG